jgi:putative sterol carrier protein
MLDTAVAALSARIEGGFDGSVKFVIADQGAVIVDTNGVRICDMDHPAQATLGADADTFYDILKGDLNPAAAFISGRLELDGDMAAAIALGTVLGE